MLFAKKRIPILRPVLVFGGIIMADILIIGADQGIGYYLTERLLESGNRVAVLDIETDHIA